MADDTFLYISGLPMFDETFGYRATSARLTGTLEQARSELARARKGLSEASFEHEALALEGDGDRELGTGHR